MDLIFSNSDSYRELSNSKNLAIKTSSPKAIYRPKNLEELIEVIKVIRCYSLDFAVRSGGHCVAGFSSTNSVLISLEKLNTLSYDQKTQILTVGPGASLGDCYSYLAQFKRSIPGGTCRSVCIGGQSLVGGIGYSTRAYGLLTDNILRYSLVIFGKNQLKTLTVDSQNNSDLFWLLRGCGVLEKQKFIVYQLSIKTFPADEVYVVNNLYSLEDPKAINLISKLTQVKNEATFQIKIDKLGIQITGQGFSENMEPLQTSAQKLSYEKALKLLITDSQPMYKRYYSQMFSHCLSRQVILKLVQEVLKVKGLVIEIHQLKGSAEGSMPWKNSLYWLDLSIHSQNKIPVEDRRKLRRIYELILPYSDSSPYSGTMNREENFYGDSENRRKLLEVVRKYFN